MASRQEKVRLDMAIRIFCHQADEDPAHQDVCEAYLKRRYRAAAWYLTENGDVSGLRCIVQKGWLSEKEKGELLVKAVQGGQTDCAALLSGSDGGFLGVRRLHAEQSAAPLWQRILACMGRELDRRYPYLGRTLHLMKKETDAAWETGGTDGFVLYIKETALLSSFYRDSESCLRFLAHCLVHAAAAHPLMAAECKEHRIWDLVCDCMAEWILEQELGWMRKLPARDRTVRDALYRWMKKQRVRSEAVLYTQAVKLGEEEFATLSRAFYTDEHGMWYEARHSTEQWHTQLMRFGRFKRGGGQEGMRGGICGSSKGMRQKYSEPEASEYDYMSFLERFMVRKEERQLDLSSFDLLLYTYSRQHYRHAVLLEPVETTEVKRLQELVIAIDTSGSCSGEIVRQFLRETFSILGKREHFFRRMRVHILQCDSMIQDYRLIESEEDWKAYQENLQIRGFGDTDFRPVFSWIEQKQEEGSIRNLKGLLYFTDGDGIYPQKPPAYETAFVYLNDRLQKGQPPEFIRTLNLQLDRDFDNLFAQERKKDRLHR